MKVFNKFCNLLLTSYADVFPRPPHEAFMTEGQWNGKKTEDKYTPFQGRANTKKGQKIFDHESRIILLNNHLRFCFDFSHFSPSKSILKYLHSLQQFHGQDLVWKVATDLKPP